MLENSKWLLCIGAANEQESSGSVAASAKLLKRSHVLGDFSEPSQILVSLILHETIMDTNKRCLSCSTDQSSASTKRQKTLSQEEELQMRIAEADEEARRCGLEVKEILCQDSSAPELVTKLRLWLLDMSLARSGRAGEELAELKPPPSQVGHYGVFSPFFPRH